MRHIEDQLQIECVRWFRLQYPDVMIIHQKNGGSLKSAKEGARFKAMGVTAGVADLQIIKSKFDNSCDEELVANGITWFKYGPITKHGLFIELKSPKGKQTPAQKEFERYVKANGYAYHVCRSFDEFKTVVENYLN